MKLPRWPTILTHTISVISLISGFVFFWLSLRTPELAYSVSPLHSRLVDTTASSQLRATWNDEIIDENVWLSRLVIVNIGRKEVLASDILKPILVTWPEKCRVLRITATGSHEVVAASAVQDTAVAARINFEILEQGDSVIVEIVYAAPSSVDFSMAGAVVGQRHIENRSVSVRFQTPQDQVRSKIVSIAIPLLLSFLLMISAGMIYFWEIVPATKRAAPVRLLWFLFASMLIMCLLGAGYAMYLYNSTKYLFV